MSIDDNAVECAMHIAKDVSVELSGVTYQRVGGVWTLDLGNSVHRLAGFESAALYYIATLTRERDEARRDAESLADSIFDFIGSRGTAYEADRYLVLCGLVRGYYGSTADVSTPTEATP